MSCLDTACLSHQSGYCCPRLAHPLAGIHQAKTLQQWLWVRGRPDGQSCTFSLITVAGGQSCCCLQVVEDATWVCTMHPVPTQRSCKLPEDLGFARDFSGAALVDVASH